MKSNLYQIKEMDGTEKVVTNLLKEYQDEFIEEQKNKFLSQDKEKLD